MPPIDRKLLIRGIPIFIRRHAQRLTVLVLWLSVAIGFWVYTQRNDLPPTLLLWRFSEWISSKIYGPLLYILAFVLRPVLFIPAAMMTVIGGFIFGPAFGLAYALVGDVASATAGYLIGWYFGEDFLKTAEEVTFIKKNTRQMRENSFLTILVLRFLILPQDLVNYAAGFMKIRWISYAAATALGALPGIIIFSQFGASLQNPVPGEIQLPHPTILIAPPILVTFSLLFTWYWRRRRRRNVGEPK